MRTRSKTSERIISHLPQGGLVRLSQILGPDGPIPVSKSSWWAGVAAGRYPQPLKLGPRITVWRAEDKAAVVANPQDWRSHANDQ